MHIVAELVPPKLKKQKRSNADDYDEGLSQHALSSRS
jgi:hypothetical protein